MGALRYATVAGQFLGRELGSDFGGIALEAWGVC